jgi:hypothetical protein
MGRLDNNDFDTIYSNNRGRSFGDREIPINRQDIDFEDRDIEPDFYSPDDEEEFGIEDNEPNFDELGFEDPGMEDDNYPDDFIDDMTIFQDLNYDDNKDEMDYDNVDDEVEYNEPETVNRQKYYTENKNDVLRLFKELRDNGIWEAELDPKLFQFLRKTGALRYPHRKNESNKDFITYMRYLEFVDKINQFHKIYK